MIPANERRFRMLFSESGRSGTKSDDPNKARRARRQRLIRIRASHRHVLTQHLMLKKYSLFVALIHAPIIMYRRDNLLSSHVPAYG
ncbi:hypothetical protein BU25DRAFT_67501 [Macroventuria anomochaeta]|uniref:Uncharacterized protein n=1 Tax=Macroventuria anomochaeta TaxID=301207 RepID=A0ACB6S0T6_9PLEO|nr:uncharacterized protein BU25DRAFT_67501 [Macroventuria anomochaeta]KAF2627008.1 hypothetical protein BU25DRAFT_67501 [Macroventuria anomochaeta]